MFLLFEVLLNEEWFAFFLFGERVKDVGERKDLLLGENLPLFLRQAKAKVIYSQSKVTAKLIYIQTLLFAIEFCDLWLPVLSPLQRMQNIKCVFVLCLSAVSSSFGLVSVMSELRLSI